MTIGERWSCVLEKGIGKRPFDPVHDQGRQRRIAIKLVITPLQGNFAVEQDVVDSSRAWQRYTLPSLRAHHLDLHTLKGRYVQVCRVPTVETFVNRAGETKRQTALVFVTVYRDRATCQAAAEAFSRRMATHGELTSLQSARVPAASSPQQGDFAERAFAEQALPILWQASGADHARFLALIAAHPLIARYFG
ncbi:MAG: hypothetical protein M3300_10855, partial [Actinomycetota bacterium]|nr:hypothetical protein [Actinomycetota bacterium]